MCTLDSMHAGCSVGVCSGVYLFNEPLKKHFEEQQRLQAQAQQQGAAAPAAAPEAGAKQA